MKTLLIALTLLATPAFAKPTTTFYCHGMNDDEGATFFAKLVGSDDIREGDKMDFVVVIRDADKKELFSGHVTAESEDVMLSFKSKRGSRPSLSAMIYMDEADQTWATIGKKEMRFDCRF